MYLDLISITQAKFNAIKTAAIPLDRPVAFFITDATAGTPNIVFGRTGQTPTAAEITGATTTGTASAGGGLRQWEAAKAFAQGDIVVASVAQGTIGIGDLIIRNAAGTSGATFDATEAATWTEVANDPDLMGLSNAQTVTGIKTFSTLPELSADATTANQAIRKSQHDTAMALKANLASPALTGTPTVPTAAAGTNTTQVASTAFVQAEIAADLATVAPLMDGTATVGTSTYMARQDHVHPSDTAKAPLASPTFTGVPAAPTATAGTNTTQMATTAFVKTAVDSATVGLLDYRGAFTPAASSGAAGYPTTGGSGTAGAILKGDVFVASGAGFILTEAIQIGDSVLAKIDAPGQTAANWDKLNANVSYVPEDVANKVTSLSGSSTDTQYPSAKLAFDQLALKAATSHTHILADVTDADSKQDALVSGTNIKTVNSQSLLGSGNIAVGASAASVTTRSGGTGGTITQVGNDRVHTFTASGTFVVPAGVTAVQALVVAGGGAGGSNYAGGGGAGELIEVAALAVTPGASLAVTVGAGGAPVADDDTSHTGGNGANSSIGSLVIAIGGGGGGGGNDNPANTAPASGGSGGGGGGYGNDAAAAGAAAGVVGTLGGGTSYRNAGGGNTIYANKAAGGGGGAGAAGANSISGTAGAGGAGRANAITGNSVLYAGGGGGGTEGGGAGAGGSGIGGAGSATGVGGAGSANTGSGGGGSRQANLAAGVQGGAGGSGVVIVRYIYQSLDTPVYANNALAIAGGLTLGMLYRTGADPDVLCVVH